MNKLSSRWSNRSEKKTLNLPSSSSSSSSNDRYPPIAERVFLLYNGIDGEIDFDIVLVHGLGSGEFKCWTNERGVLWPAVFLPQEFPRCRILSAGYAHTLWQWISFEKTRDYIVNKNNNKETEGTVNSIRRWMTSAVSSIDSDIELENKNNKSIEESKVNQNNLKEDINLTHDIHSSIKSEQQTLERCAADLAERLLSDKVGIGKRPVVFIAHSLGGLVIKQMILSVASIISMRRGEGLDEEINNKNNSPEEGLLSSLRGVVFYSTPHFGAPIASVVTGLKKYYQTLGGIGPSRVLAALGDHNKERLSSLNDQFFHVIERCSNNGYVHILSFGETQRLNGVIRVVEPESANPVPDDARFPFYLLDADHMQVNRPVSKDQPSYTILFGFLERMRRNGLLETKIITNGNKSLNEKSNNNDNSEGCEEKEENENEIFFQNSKKNTSGNDGELEIRILITSLKRRMKQIFINSKTIFGCRMPMELDKLLTLSNDMCEYVTTCLPLSHEKKNLLLLTPLRLLNYWIERSILTMETIMLCQSEYTSPLRHLSSSENRSLREIDRGVVTLRREWEWFHCHICQTCIPPKTYLVVLFFLQTITITVGDAMIADCGFLLALTLRCLPEACFGDSNALISLRLQEKTEDIPSFISATAWLLTGWFCLGVTKQYGSAISAFRHLISDIEIIERESSSLSSITIPNNVNSNNKEISFISWWNNESKTEEKDKSNTKQKTSLLQAFSLLAHAGLCWSQLKLNQRTEVIIPFNLSDTSINETTLQQFLKEARNRYDLLEKSLQINNITDKPFISNIYNTTLSPSKKKGIKRNTLKKLRTWPTVRISAIPKSFEIRRSITVLWNSVRQGESNEEATERFIANILVFWWVIEKRMEFYSMKNSTNNSMFKRRYDLNERAVWVLEKVDPNIKSQWITWRFILNEELNNNDKKNVGSNHLLTEALRLHTRNALALCLFGRQLLMRRYFSDAADAYIRVLEITRNVIDPLYRAAAVGLGWVHLHYHNSDIFTENSTDTLSFRGSPNGFNDWCELEKCSIFKTKKKKLPNCPPHSLLNFSKNNNYDKDDDLFHLKRASALFEVVLSFNPNDKGALCGMGRVKTLTTEAAYSVDFSSARSYFMAVFKSKEVKSVYSQDQEEDIAVIDNILWESRAAYWLGEISKYSLDVETKESNSMMSKENITKKWWEYAASKCPENDWVLTSLGILYAEKDNNNDECNQKTDIDVSSQRKNGISFLQRSLNINAKNTWTLWGLARFAPDIEQRHMYRMLLRKLLKS